MEYSYLFFFSSRRRHTRFDCDWSSDVCSSDLVLRGRGYDAATGIPYGPVVEALRGALAAPGLGGAAPEWLTEALRPGPELRQRFPTPPEPAPPADPSGRGRPVRAVAPLSPALRAAP